MLNITCTFALNALQEIEIATADVVSRVSTAIGAVQNIGYKYFP